MYNRYIRNDNGTYTRIPQEDHQERPRQAPSQQQAAPGNVPPHSGAREAAPPPFSGPPPHRNTTGPQEPPPFKSVFSGKIPDSLTGILRHVLDQLHLNHVDTGDLLLLVLLFFLFREDADEELLVALGLLLIL